MPEHKHSGAKHTKSSERLHGDVGGEEVVVGVGSKELQQGRGHHPRSDDSQNQKE